MHGIQVAAIVAGVVALVSITAAVLLARRARRTPEDGLPTDTPSDAGVRPNARMFWPTLLAILGGLALVATMLLVTMAVFAAAAPSLMEQAG